MLESLSTDEQQGASKVFWEAEYEKWIRENAERVSQELGLEPPDMNRLMRGFALFLLQDTASGKFSTRYGITDVSETTKSEILRRIQLVAGMPEVGEEEAKEILNQFCVSFQEQAWVEASDVETAYQGYQEMVKKIIELLGGDLFTLDRMYFSKYYLSFRSEPSKIN
ncbi:hypothetical protein GYA49_03090 [Candidatus Beckwithbacteria bacterium]|nr:hypothetical protein [Candidatus Beckwithbacteria bacterium]